jgi:hypothetical protein
MKIVPLEFRPHLLSKIKSAEQVPENIGQLRETFSTGCPQNKPRRNLWEIPLRTLKFNIKIQKRKISK